MNSKAIYLFGMAAMAEKEEGPILIGPGPMDLTYIAEADSDTRTSR